MDKKSCFVIMPFAEPFETYYKKIIKPAIDDNELYAVRGDSLFRSTHIMDDIWSAITEATIVIAELTGKNPNVYYELGLAHAMKKPAILISSNIEDVPFDLRPLRVLIYDKNEPDWGVILNSNISKAIDETLSSPTEAIPHTFREYKLPKTRHETTLAERLTFLEGQVNDLVVDSYTDSSIEKVELSLFDLGDRVKHYKFGCGQIIRFEGAGTKKRVQVNFDNYGLKWLLVSLTKFSQE
jgi:hypothetical protein